MRSFATRLLTVLSVIAFVIALAVPAHADLKIVARKWFTGLDTINAKSDTQYYNVDEVYTYYYKNDRYREDSSVSRIYFIYDCANDKYYTLDRANKVYSIQTLEDALTKRKGLMSRLKVMGKAKVEPGGSSRTISGKAAKNYTMTMDVVLKDERSGANLLSVSMEGEQWVTNSVKINAKCQRILKAAYARGIFTYNAIMEPLFSQLEGIGGVPLSYDMIINLSAIALGAEGGTIEAHSDVTAISTATLATSLFQVPKDFRLVPRVVAPDAGG